MAKTYSVVRCKSGMNGGTTCKTIKTTGSRKNAERESVQLTRVENDKSVYYCIETDLV